MIINTEKWSMDSPMETLYTYYAEKYPINNAQIWERSEALTQVIPQELQEDVLAAVSLLVAEHEKEAFIRGFQTGVCLCQELEA